MSGGIGLMVIGSVMWLAAYYFPRRFHWAERSDATRSMRNRPGEAIARVVGPSLMVVGLVLVIGAAA